MSKLRIREEELRKPREMSASDRERVVRILKDVLSREERVELAVLHGGFLNNEVFRDIDIALLLRGAGNELVYVEELRDRLEKLLGIGIDIQILNDASPNFVYHVLSKGRVLVEKRPGIAAIARIHALEEVKRLKRVENIFKDVRSNDYRSNQLRTHENQHRHTEKP